MSYPGQQFQILRISDSNVDILNKTRLGSGSYGDVYKAKYRQDEKTEFQPVAIKFVKKDTNAANVREQYGKLMREAAIMFSMKGHENTVEVYGIHECTFGLGIIMEYMEGGSMDRLVSNMNLKYTFDHFVSWMFQLSSAVDFFHSQSQLHRDLKLQNLLLCDNYRRLKVCDYGTFTCTRDSLTSLRGTPVTMAPEVILANRYDSKCDIYSIGIIMWQILSRRKPYENVKNVEAVFWMVARQNTRPNDLECSPLISGFYKRCWDADPQKRPTSSEMLEYFTILQKFFPAGDEPISEASTHKTSYGAPLGVSHHVRSASDGSTYVMPNPVPSPSTPLTPVRHAPPIPSPTPQTVRPAVKQNKTHRTDLPMEIIENVDQQYWPREKIAGNKESEDIYDSHVAVCTNLMEVNQCLNEALATKHAAIRHVSDIIEYKKLLDKKKQLEDLRDKAKAQIRAKN